MSKVFYVPGERWASEDVITVDGKEVGRFSKKTIEEAQKDNPLLVCLEKEECVREIIKIATQPAQEITGELFTEMRNILPPCAWVRNKDNESFHMSEFDVFDITSIYVRIGQRYFRLRDTYKLAHDERIAKVKEVYPDA